MTIPDFQAIMLPLLQYASDGKEHSLRDAITFLADVFNLSDDERKELLSSGQQAVFDNRVGWARTYLKKAGLFISPKRGFFQITDRGKEILSQNPSEINLKFLNQFPEFIEFKTTKKDNDKSEPEIIETSETTPQESIEFGYQKIRKELELELLNRVKSCSPDFFERLVVDLLVKMGYGGSRRDAGRAIGKSGDGGIDGIIKEDKLGLDIVYVQAKRWDNTVVGRPEIQKFVGALHGQRARKGVFITTSRFSQEAREYVSIIDSKIVLIDGEELAQLMIDNHVGVSTVSIYEIKKIDSDYFTDE
ncbi:restriction endonuclease [Dolichospermum circinale]|uniref:restriction endonuclease n=1 Tax=Dolichospermum circinale TaxID=109265 RepID=UPI00040BEAEF|nr:restriction endonuclease [Dolichospermum circinale]MBO1046261.1 restriction endonuclease [Dolichospermum sp. DEX182a]MDB9482812.1 restriction endonuclease [Dolichospermum circinale CS-537/05]QSV62494.1 MAG: restriction endonuclease [Dolichospermum sp. DL01]MDB9476751.1 restriction endonuclease [Dolichospermum circinale CS-537/11]MDB9480310.1 restriction endonuclease [Dolichospermum circinale CS-537/03]